MIAERLYAGVSLIRHAELKIVEVYEQDIMRTPVHLSIGQESISVAVCEHLTREDLAIGTHRGHALYLARGGSLYGLFAELLGRVDGCSGGYGGSMHLIDLESGLLGTSSIVGGALPIAVGVGAGLKLPRISCVIFGDGACDEGIFYESLNFAQLKRLPVLFVCENNRYSIYTHERQRRSAKAYRIAEALGLKSLYLPIEIANDAVLLWEALDQPIRRIREGQGPLFVECETVRTMDHHGVRSDVERGFRPQEEAELASRFCPLFLTARHIDAKLAELTDTRVRYQVQEAFELALKGQPLEADFSKVKV